MKLADGETVVRCVGEDGDELTLGRHCILFLMRFGDEVERANRKLNDEGRSLGLYGSSISMT